MVQVSVIKAEQLMLCGAPQTGFDGSHVEVTHALLTHEEQSAVGAAVGASVGASVGVAGIGVGAVGALDGAVVGAEVGGKVFLHSQAPPTQT